MTKNTENKAIEHNLQDVLKLPDDLYFISSTKLQISNNIHKVIKERNLKMGDLKELTGLSKGSIVDVLGAENFRIEDLLKLLYKLDLTISVSPMKEEYHELNAVEGDNTSGSVEPRQSLDDIPGILRGVPLNTSGKKGAKEVVDYGKEGKEDYKINID
jgi:predicted XRE-type DNA-binding protein